MTGLVGILRNVPLGQRSITATPSDMSSFYLAARETSGPDNRQLSSAVVLVEDRNGDSAYSYPQMTLMDQGKRLNKGQINQTDDRYRYCNARKAFETYEIDADEERWIFDAASREEEIYQSEVLIPFLILNGETIETYEDLEKIQEDRSDASLQLQTVQAILQIRKGHDLEAALNISGWRCIRTPDALPGLGYGN